MKEDRISRRQFVAMAFVGTLSPLIRRFPQILAAIAGRSAWLSAAFAVIPAAVILAAAHFLFRRHPAGYREVLTDVLGAALGRTVIGLYALWFLFYAGFLLRSGAVRFLSTVYPGAAATPFILVAAALGTLAASGSLRAIARSAMLFRPLLAAVLIAAPLLSLRDLDFSLLVPVTSADLLPNGIAALETVNALSSAACLAFLGDRLEKPLRPRDYAPWAGLLLVLLGAVTAACIGVFGAGLTAKLRYPFFMLVRDISVLGSLERAEPVVIALWVFSDFVALSVLLRIAAENLRCSLGLSKPRRILPLCAAAAAAVGFCVARDTAAFALFSDAVIPLANAAMVFAVPAVVLLVGIARKKV